MTFSILVRDPQTNTFGGAAATGNLCVGGWVLRGDPSSGMSASQGKSPSTLWGSDVLLEMREGATAEGAVEKVVIKDPGRQTRQLLALDCLGNAGCFTGSENLPICCHVTSDNLVAGGNMLCGETVINECVEHYQSSHGSVARRLLAGLVAGQTAGGDERGLLSCAISVFSTDKPPMTLRIDYSETPLDDLNRLVALTEREDYSAWLTTLPSLNNPFIG